MDFSHLFFGFNGRIPRSAYWLGTLALSAYVLLVVGFAIFMGVELGPRSLLLMLLALPAVFCGLALVVKRLHDRDKSGWWVLLFYFAPGALHQIGRHSGDIGILFWIVGSAISIWALVEIGFLRGTPGPNRFGPDPLPRPYPA
jgi:uncharacterized membrane protein YhaH (DUF805 family)